MIFCENVPQCLCGHIFSLWKSSITVVDFDSARFILECPDCKRELRILKKQKLEFEIYNTKDEFETRKVLDKEITGWTYVGERYDGSHYSASVFSSEEAMKSFFESNKYVPVAMGSFKMTYQSIDKEHYLKEKN